MYAVQKVNTKEILAKTRRGLPQKNDPLGHKIAKNKRDSDHLPVNEISNPAKPFFHNKPRKLLIQKDVKQISPQHQEMIKYIHENWCRVVKEFENGDKTPDSSATSNATSPCTDHKTIYYKNKSASTPEFEPFDLEYFWGQRLYQNLTKSA
ncbi:uncharacterized protein LOC141858101 [Brevipalpus obovatus]|uniref:uncharacterized protein LOC141858101 n=1 Tax=Brevipalpus obovatus TaxID=246614 RepID=UPI003D9FA8CF